MWIASCRQLRVQRSDTRILNHAAKYFDTIGETMRPRLFYEYAWQPSKVTFPQELAGVTQFGLRMVPPCKGSTRRRHLFCAVAPVLSRGS